MTPIQRQFPRNDLIRRAFIWRLLFVLGIGHTAIANDHGVPAGHGARESESSDPQKTAPSELIYIQELPNDRPIPADLFATWFTPQTVLAYAAVEVTLSDITPLALRSPKIVLRYPKGGGKLNLSDFVKSKEGLFRLQIRFTDEPATRGAFVSLSKQRRVEDEILGLGCGKWADITSLSKKDLASPGITLSIANASHITAAAGQFILLRYMDETAMVGQIYVTDQKYKPLLCEVPWS